MAVHRMGIFGYRTKYPKKGSLKGRFSNPFSFYGPKTHPKKIINKDHGDNEKRGRVKIAILLRPLTCKLQFL